MSSFRKESVVPFPHIRTLRSADFEKLVLLDQQLEAEGRTASVSTSGSSYYLRMCCEHFQDTSLIVEEDGETTGYLLAFVQGREAFCGAFGVSASGRNSKSLTEHLVEHFIAKMAPQVEVLWWTVPMESAEKRAHLHRMGAVEVEHRADFGGRGTGRVLVRLCKEDMLPISRNAGLFGTIGVRP